MREGRLLTVVTPRRWVWWWARHKKGRSLTEALNSTNESFSMCLSKREQDVGVLERRWESLQDLHIAWIFLLQECWQSFSKMSSWCLYTSSHSVFKETSCHFERPKLWAENAKYPTANYCSVQFLAVERTTQQLQLALSVEVFKYYLSKSTNTTLW